MVFFYCHISARLPWLFASRQNHNTPQFKMDHNTTPDSDFPFKTLIWVLCVASFVFGQRFGQSPMFSFHQIGTAVGFGLVAAWYLNHLETMQKHSRVSKPRSRRPLKLARKPKSPVIEERVRTPRSAYRRKFFLTPETETFPAEITRPVRPVSAQNSSSNSATSGRISKPIKTHKGLRRQTRTPNSILLPVSPKPIASETHGVPKTTKATKPSASYQSPSHNAPIPTKSVQTSSYILSPRNVPLPNSPPGPTKIPSHRSTESSTHTTLPETVSSPEIVSPHTNVPPPKPATPSATTWSPTTPGKDTGMKSPIIQRIAACADAFDSDDEQVNHPPSRRASESIFPYHVVRQLQRIPSDMTVPQLFDAMYNCIIQGGVVRPGQEEMVTAISLLNHEPSSAFYVYVSEELARKANEPLTQEELEVLLPGVKIPQVPFELRDKNFHRVEVVECSGGVNPADTKLIRKNQDKRDYMLSHNDYVICDANLPFAERVQIQPNRLWSWRTLNDIAEYVFYRPQQGMQSLPREYVTTNRGLALIAEKVGIIQGEAEARFSTRSSEQERMAIQNDADNQILHWMSRLGGYINSSKQADDHRGRARYAEDITPYSRSGGLDREAIAEVEEFWRTLWGEARAFWDKYHFAGEYNENGYIWGNNSEGHQMHLAIQRKTAQDIKDAKEKRQKQAEKEADKVARKRKGVSRRFLE